MKTVITESQAVQRRLLGMSMEDFTIADQLPDEERRPEPAPIPRIEQLRQRAVAGLLTESDIGELETLTAKKEKAADPILEIRHKVAAGLISLNEAVTLSAAVKQTSGDTGKKLLTEQLLTESQCADGCDCHDCHMENFQECLEGMVSAGRITDAQAKKCYEIRCNLTD